MMGVSVTMDTRSHLLAGFQHNMDDMTRIPPQHCAKVFIQRDYSEGTAVRFQNKFPSELEGKIERQAFEYTINQLNSMYIEAETLSSRTYCESCFACLTAYLAYLCMETHYEKMLKKIARFVQDQNNSVYIPRGLMLIDPAERGLRIVTPFGYSACIFASIKMFPSNSSVSQTYFGSFSLVPRIAWTWTSTVSTRSGSPLIFKDDCQGARIVAIGLVKQKRN